MRNCCPHRATRLRAWKVSARCLQHGVWVPLVLLCYLAPAGLDTPWPGYAGTCDLGTLSCNLALSVPALLHHTLGASFLLLASI